MNATKQKLLSDIEETNSPQSPLTNSKLAFQPNRQQQQQYVQQQPTSILNRPRASISSFSYQQNEFNSSPRNSPLSWSNSQAPIYSTKPLVLNANPSSVLPFSYLQQQQQQQPSSPQANINTKIFPFKSNNISKISVQVRPNLDFSQLNEATSNILIIIDTSALFFNFYLYSLF